MFREMRRFKQLLSEEETYKIIDNTMYGVLGVIGDDGYPYTVSVNHVRDGNKIYFHSAKAGHKNDAILANPKVSFHFVDKDDIVEEEYTTYFRSANVFGTATFVEDEEEKVHAFRILCEKTCPEHMHKFEKAMAGSGKNAVVVRVDIEQMTGKESLDLMNSRKK